MTSSPIPAAVLEARTLINSPGRDWSRQQLATALGTSTKTLQRILAEGKNGVPDLSRVRSAKAKLSWIRTFVRIARYFGKDPAPWIESLGVPWDPAMGRYSTPNYAAPGGTFEGTLLDPVLDSIQRSGSCPSSQVVRVSYPDFPPFTGLYKHFGAHLIGSINPDWKIDLQPQKEGFDVEMKKLRGDTDSCHAIIGIFDSMPRRLMGLDFVTIPGWEVPLKGIYYRPERAAGPEPTWQLISDPDYAKQHFHAVVAAGEVGYYFLKGDCQYDNSLLTIVRTMSSAEILETFTKWVEGNRNSTITLLLVIEEGTCRKVWAELFHKYGERIGVVETLKDRFGLTPCPCYRIGIMVRSDASSWKRLLELARDWTMFGSRIRNTAALYADTIVEGRRLFVQAFDGVHNRSAWHLADFNLVRTGYTEAANEAATLVFRRELVSRLVQRDANIKAEEIRQSLTPSEWWSDNSDSNTQSTGTNPPNSRGPQLNLHMLLEDLTNNTV